MTDLLHGLNTAQREAVTATEGFVRVIAGAGSGKTRALTRRFAYLVTELGILPGHILCVTFTNKAANEMRRRIHNLTGDNDTGYINTFHGFCVSVLQEDSYAVSYPKRFLVLDNSDIDSMLRVIYEERGLSLRDMTFSAARDMIEIEKLKNRPEYYRELIALSPDELKEKYEKADTARDIIFFGYLWQEKKCFALDYNDLIVFTLHIFSQNEEIRLKWQKRLEYIMIDEFQDIDEPQYRLMKALCAYHKNLFIVGDPDQTIYTWRGANVRFLLDFDKEFPGTRTIMMMENYRSTPQILAAANALIEKNASRIKKDLIPTLPEGASVLCHYAENSEAEAKWILSEIRKLESGGVPLREITVLYRAHYITRSLEELFLKEKLPYTIYSGVQFFDRMEIKDALSYLRMLCYRDDFSFLRTANAPKRNLGQRRMAFLREYADKNACTLYEALRRTREEEIFRGTKAGKYISLIEYYTALADGRPVSELLAAILHESGYEEMLRIRDFLRRRVHARALSQARRAIHQRRHRRGARQDQADDRAQRQGPRVPLRLPLRDERGRLPGQKDRDAPRHGGGAASGLRGRDARGEAPVLIRERGAQLRRRAEISIALPAGYRRGEPGADRAAARGPDRGREGVYRVQRKVPARAGGGERLRARRARQARDHGRGHGRGARF